MDQFYHLSVSPVTQLVFGMSYNFCVGSIPPPLCRSFQTVWMWISYRTLVFGLSKQFACGSIPPPSITLMFGLLHSLRVDQFHHICVWPVPPFDTNGALVNSTTSGHSLVRQFMCGLILMRRDLDCHIHVLRKSVNPSTVYVLILRSH